MSSIDEKVSVKTLGGWSSLKGTQHRFDMFFQKTPKLGIICQDDGRFVGEVFDVIINLYSLSQIYEVCLEDFVYCMWREPFFSVDW